MKIEITISYKQAIIPEREIVEDFALSSTALAAWLRLDVIQDIRLRKVDNNE